MENESNKLIIPNDLRELIEEATYEEQLNGKSKSRVYKIKNIYGMRNGFLKIAEKNHGEVSLASEKIVYDWLKGKVKVPEVIYYKEESNLEYLLMSEIDGTDMGNLLDVMKKEEIIKLVAKGLKELHEISITNCPIDKRLLPKLSMAQRRINMGLINEEQFEAVNKEKSANDIFQELLIRKPLMEDIVFTHGDYSFDNILIKDSIISGYVDMGKAGIGDRYVDIAIALRSIAHEFGSKEFWEVFMNEYGMEGIDYDKVEYYILLDELI